MSLLSLINSLRGIIPSTRKNIYLCVDLGAFKILISNETSIVSRRSNSELVKPDHASLLQSRLLTSKLFLSKISTWKFNWANGTPSIMFSIFNNTLAFIYPDFIIFQKFSIFVNYITKILFFILFIHNFFTYADIFNVTTSSFSISYLKLYYIFAIW